jgi:hypothetical protein
VQHEKYGNIEHRGMQAWVYNTAIFTEMLQVGYQEARAVATALYVSSIFDSGIYLLGCGKYIVTVSGYVFSKYIQ